MNFPLRTAFTQLIFVWWSSVLKSCQIHLLILRVFLQTLEFSTWTIMSSISRHHLIFSFSISCYFFICLFVYCLIILARTPSVMLSISMYVLALFSISGEEHSVLHEGDVSCTSLFMVY